MNLSFNVGDDVRNVHANRELFFGALDIRLDELAIPGQVHGTTVRCANTPGAYPKCDALVSQMPRVFLCVSVADCVPVFLFDKKNNVIAGIHAGWRGTAGKIVQEVIAVMQRTFSSHPSDLLAYIGPAAAACCYAVGDEVASQFAETFLHHVDGKVHVDLKAANLSQLLSTGVHRSSIEVSTLCTITDATLHSYRRDRERSGRMIGVLGLL